MKKSEVDILLKNLVIIVDTREKINKHITNYFESRGIPYVVKCLKYGDYSAFIRYNENTKDLISDVLNFNNKIAIERKNSVNELVGNFKHRERFNNEFLRAKQDNCKLILHVEELDGLNNIIYGIYRSEYNPKALYASLKSFESTYNFQTKFVDRKLSGLEIYYTLYYEIRNYLLKGGVSCE